ncbi:MAG: hypothetical protein DI535_10000 [Citrobacter freundii]|nr:MAG: hypothetical protein DI535_10000 [Citrobacter freundii]
MYKFQLQMYSPEEKRMFQFLDSAIVFSNGSRLVFKLSHAVGKPKVVGFKQTEFVDSLGGDVGYSYFATDLSSDMGYQYWPSRPKKNRFVSAKSFFAQKMSLNEAMFSSEDELLFKKIDTVPGFLAEIYVPKNKLDESYPDTSYYEYRDSFAATGFSMSRRLDSIKEKKLVKAVFAYSAKEDPANGKVPRREFVFELRAITTEKDTVAQRLLTDPSILKSHDH